MSSPVGTQPDARGFAGSSYGKVALSSLVVVGIGLLVFAAWSQGSLQWDHRFRFPYRDFATVTAALDANPSPTLLDLYKMLNFNEHRIVIPYYFYLADRRYFGSSNALLYTTIYVFNALLVAVVLWPAARLHARMGVGFAGLLAAAMLYWFFAAFNWENLAFQIQVCETGSLALLGLALLASARISSRDDVQANRNTDVLLALLAGGLGLAASYSFGMGLVAWPVIGLHAVLRRWRAAPLFIFGAFATFTVGSYAYWYLAIADFRGQTFHTSAGSALGHPVRLGLFVLNVLAWPPSQMVLGLPYNLARWSALGATLVGGAGAAVLAARVYLRAPNQTESGRQRAAQLAVMILISGIGIAVLSGLSRSGAMSGWGRSSYAVASSLFWCGLAVLLALETRVRAAKVCVGIFALATVAMAYVPARAYDLDITARDQMLYRAGVMATFGLYLGPDYPSLNGDDPHLQALWNGPRIGAPSFAQREPFKWLGRTMNLPQVATAVACQGQIEKEVSEADPRVKIEQGWVVMEEAPVRWVLFTNQEKVVVGVGKPGLSGPNSAPGPFGRHDRFEVLAVSESKGTLAMWAVDAKGRACRVAAPR